MQYDLIDGLAGDSIEERIEPVVNGTRTLEQEPGEEPGTDIVVVYLLIVWIYATYVVTAQKQNDTQKELRKLANA